MTRKFAPNEFCEGGPEDTVDCGKPARWYRFAMLPNCDDPSCCGMEYFHCDEHKRPEWNDYTELES